MGTLWVRIALVSSVGILFVALFTVAFQDIAASRSIEGLNPIFREAFIYNEAHPDLTQEEQFELFSTALQQTANSEEEVGVFLNQLRSSFQTQRRLPRLAALISLPLALLFASVSAYLIARPIRLVSRAAEQVTQGNLSARAPVLSRQSGDELLELTTNFNQMAETLERLESERQNMIADIAHELRTPLTVLKGQVSAMRDGVRPVNDANLGSIENQTLLLTRLVGDLRTLSLADVGRLSLDMAQVNLVQLAQRVTDGFRARASEAGVQLEFINELNGPLSVTGDRDRLEQVLSNLLSNALAHTPASGKVSLTLNQDETTALLSVQDSGSGISDDVLPHLFERFRRGEKSRKAVKGGSGLGLAIVKVLLDLHQAQITVSNVPTGGSKFEVRLPLAPSTAEAQIAK